MYASAPACLPTLWWDLYKGGISFRSHQKIAIAYAQFWKNIRKRRRRGERGGRLLINGRVGPMKNNRGAGKDMKLKNKEHLTYIIMWL